jgi:hypothetical protein
VRLFCYSRGLDPESKVESGVLGHQLPLKDDSGIVDVQGVEGGVYYLTGDKKLHFMKGARP